jgi:hypothetical protein
LRYKELRKMDVYLVKADWGIEGYELVRRSDIMKRGGYYDYYYGYP